MLLSLSKDVPTVANSIREGKNQINARIEYFGFGINLRSEKPTPERIRRAADRLTEPRWKRRAMVLSEELIRHLPYELIDDPEVPESN